MKKILFLLVAVLGLGCGGTLGAQLPDIKKLEKTLDGELVEVVYDLQYDKFGNPPAAVGIYCAACSVFHDQDLGRLLENRQPLRVTGYMVGNDLVLAPDIFIDADGVKNLQIQYRGQSAAASVKTVYPEQGAVLLQLREPLPGSRVMEFTPELSGELFAYSRIMENGRWVARLQPFSRERAVHFYAPARYSYMIPGNSVIVNSQGKVAAVLTNSNETINQTQWNTPWTSWQGIAAQAFARQRGQLAKHLRQSIWPVLEYLAGDVELGMGGGLWLVEDAPARRAVESGGEEGVAAFLTGLEQAAPDRPLPVTRTAGEVYADLLEWGCAYVPILLLPPEEGQPLQAGGYGVIREGRLTGVVKGEAARGLELLVQRPGGQLRCD